jgi:hypothetical protein
MVQVNGHAESAKSFPTKIEAIKAAESNNGGAQIVVHGRHGQIFHSFALDSKRRSKIRDAVQSVVTSRKPRKAKIANLAV